MTVDVRVASPADYDRIVAVVDDWWADRSTRASHAFSCPLLNTSRVVEDEQGLAGFLVAFISPAQPQWPTSTSVVFGLITARPGWPAPSTTSAATRATTAAANCEPSLRPATLPPSASMSASASLSAVRWRTTTAV